MSLAPASCPEIMPTIPWRTASTITTVAGNGAAGRAGDGGLAVAARLNAPRSMAVGPDGALYIADTNNHSIRGVGPDGIIATLAGTGRSGYSGDGGPATNARLAGPRGVAIAPDGTLYIADTANHCLRKVISEGTIATVAGTGVPGGSGDGGLAALAQLSWPQDAALGVDGSVYIADTGNHRIRRLNADGTICTVVGTGVPGSSGDGGRAVEAQLAAPRGVAVAADGSLYIGDTDNHRVRKVAPDGSITAVAGNRQEGYGGDGGPATVARLSWPRGVAVGADGALFIADCGNSRVRRVAPDGTITTVAGNGTCGYSGDGGEATRAELDDPHGLAIGPDGSLYIGEPHNHCVRKLWGVA